MCSVFLYAVFFSSNLQPYNPISEIALPSFPPIQAMLGEFIDRPGRLFLVHANMHYIATFDTMLIMEPIAIRVIAPVVRNYRCVRPESEELIHLHMLRVIQKYYLMVGKMIIRRMPVE